MGSFLPTYGSPERGHDSLAVAVLKDLQNHDRKGVCERILPPTAFMGKEST